MSDSVHMQVYMNGERCAQCRLGVVPLQAASVLVPKIIYLETYIYALQLALVALFLPNIVQLSQI